MWRDLYTRTIPDTVSVLILGLGFCRYTFDIGWHDGIHGLETAAALFVFLIPVYRMGWLGGGDIKLMVSTTFLIGLDCFLGWFVVMTLVGGILSILVLAWYLAGKLGWRFARLAESPDSRKDLTVPYGIAISLGALWDLFLQSGLPGAK
jgi:prepilin peptidase CpaA